MIVGMSHSMNVGSMNISMNVSMDVSMNVSKHICKLEQQFPETVSKTGDAREVRCAAFTFRFEDCVVWGSAMKRHWDRRIPYA